MSSTSKPIAAAYIRMSTDKQEHSPARQRSDILALAEREGHQVTKWYEDHGKTGTESKKRTGFQQLLKDATAGKFTALLLSEQSRMSREDPFDVFQHYKLLRDAGIVVITPQGKLDMSTISGLILSLVGAHGSHDESRKIASRVATGKRNAMLRGQRQGGAVFGFDREIRDSSGALLRRVHFRDQFQKPVGYTSNLVPSSDQDAVSAVRHAFEAVAAGELIADVQRWFNEQKIMTATGKKFINMDIRRILTNPLYSGTVRHGYQSGVRSKFYTTCPDGPHLTENAVPKIVSPKLFEKVQLILKGRHKKRTTSLAGRYLLVGLLKCGHCGEKMYGALDSFSAKSKGKSRYYRCTPESMHRSHREDNPHAEVKRPSVKIDTIEEAVMSAIRDTVLSPKNRTFMIEQIANRGRDTVEEKSADESRLAEVQADIVAGERNLARAATDDDYDAISRSLATWRAEAAALRLKVRTVAGDRGALTGDAKATIASLEWACQNFENGPRPQLADYLKQAILHVEVSVADVGRHQGYKMRAMTGWLHFAPDLYPVPVDLTEWLVSSSVKSVLRCLRSSGGPMSPVDVIQASGMGMKAVQHSLKKAKGLGLVKVGPFLPHKPRLWEAASQ